MEYGGITPFGLPADWRLLIDSRVPTRTHVLVGSGIRGSKIWTPTSALIDIPNAEVVDIAMPIGE